MSKFKTFLFVLLFTPMVLFSQDWLRRIDIEDTLYSFDVDVEVWVWQDYDSYEISLEDYESTDWTKIKRNISSILTFLELRGSKYGISMSNFTGMSFIYVWYDGWNEDWEEDDYWDNSWEMIMDSIWLDGFYKANRTDKTRMIDRLVNVVETLYQEQFDSYFQDDIIQYENDIFNQNQLQELLQPKLPETKR